MQGELVLDAQMSWLDVGAHKMSELLLAMLSVGQARKWDKFWIAQHHSLCVVIEALKKTWVTLC